MRKRRAFVSGQFWLRVWVRARFGADAALALLREGLDAGGESYI